MKKMTLKETEVEGIKEERNPHGRKMEEVKDVGASIAVIKSKGPLPTHSAEIFKAAVPKWRGLPALSLAHPSHPTFGSRRRCKSVRGRKDSGLKPFGKSFGAGLQKPSPLGGGLLDRQTARRVWAATLLAGLNVGGSDAITPGAAAATPDPALVAGMARRGGWPLSAPH